MTISSRAELEGAHTKTCDFLPTSLPTRVGGVTFSRPKASTHVGVGLGGSQGFITSLFTHEHFRQQPDHNMLAMLHIALTVNSGTGISAAVCSAGFIGCT